jgi:hypothetical protein
MSSKLEIILNKEALEQMGIVSKAIFTVEYDVASKVKIPKNATATEKAELVKKNKLATKIRNKLLFALKFKIVATQHLESSWIITKEKLETAIEELDVIKDEMRACGFSNVDRRLRIIPILTTEEGYENYEEQKRQYLLNFATEHIQYCDNGLTEERMPKSTLWRCKKAYEYIEMLSEELKDADAKLEVKDTAHILSDKIAQIENLLDEQEEERKKEEGKK